ncbi:MAG: hypothetical protein QM569_15305 [Acidovorax sp.]|uniref:hypothetical protein n=1 Tax=Acidovorax sp. TaxID=1872122 RepID=UPI0039E67C41
MEIMGQSGAGMLGVLSVEPAPITRAQALERLPQGTTISEQDGCFITVTLPIDWRSAEAFADFTYPNYIPGKRMGWPCFTLRVVNLGAFVRHWELWA